MAALAGYHTFQLVGRDPAALWNQCDLRLTRSSIDALVDRPDYDSFQFCRPDFHFHLEVFRIIGCQIRVDRRTAALERAYLHFVIRRIDPARIWLPRIGKR